MNNLLVIVESPTKAKTLARFLGQNYRIVASMGHIRDLPKSRLGVDLQNNYQPDYIIPREKNKNVKLLKQEAQGKKTIILATDPDREGEAIAYHVQYLLSQKNNDFHFQRIVFHEITQEAVEKALLHPRQIDLNLFNAQQARRILDRLVGYRLSPLLWYKIKKGLSAGRVQSVAVRLIVEREREIENFKPVEYWLIQAELTKENDKNNPFLATLIEFNQQKIEIKNKETADKILSDLKSASYLVSKSKTQELKRFPPPPFTTSTLQQAGANRLGFSSRQTMKLAQDLYEEGLITYHRTDSLNIAALALNHLRHFIEKEYGRKYLPEKPFFYKTKVKNAQEAHEAIRPTNVERKKETINLTAAHQKLYELIRQRFIASQMKEAIYSQTTVDISAGSYLFRAYGTKVLFAGWRLIYGVSQGESVFENEKEVKLPPLSLGEKLDLVKLIPLQKFTSPPPYYTEASLIKILEEYGIGRPSTYAPIISTIQERGYVFREDRKLKSTEMGKMVNDFLVKFFPQVIDFGFTAKMEDNLDKIAQGELNWIPVVDEFFKPFDKKVEKVKETALKVVLPVVKTGEKCPSCHNPLIVKEGKFGKFIACSNYPQCQFTKNFFEKTGVTCPHCQKGEIIAKKTKKGRVFYGCSRYPACRFASWQKPKNPLAQKKQ